MINKHLAKVFLYGKYHINAFVNITYKMVNPHMRETGSATFINNIFEYKYLRPHR